jgi:hypothetical protein
MTNEEIMEINGLSLKDLLIYDENSISFLRWDLEKRNSLGMESRSVLKDHAGAKNKHGYFEVNFIYKSHKVHRIIYEMFNGPLPEGYFIDHIDGNKGNNNKDNLRAVTRTLNARNSVMRSNNKSGTNGVRKTKNTSKGIDYWSWQGYWTNLDGTTSAKTFSINKYGEELAEHLAKEYRLHQIDLLNLMGAGYTDRHCK